MLQAALAQSGVVESLFAFTVENDSDYKSAWRLVRYLHRAGHIRLWTRPGYPTVILRPTVALPGVPVRLRHDPAFSGLLLGRGADGTALVMVQRRGHTDHAARHIAHIPYPSLIPENIMDTNLLSLTPFDRILPNKEQVALAKRIANKVAGLPPLQREGAVLTMVLENISLFAECNTHRAERGLEPLPVGEVKNL
jgi:hypothetical protein